MHVMTHNAYYKAMTGEDPRCRKNKCVLNLLRCIRQAKHPVLVALQEASIKKKMVRAMRDILGHHTYVRFHSTESDIITFYNTNLGAPKVITGNYEKNRPFLILIFPKKRLIFINQHHGHNAHHLIKDINNKILSKLVKYKKYRIIIAGDFNDHKKMLAKRKVVIGKQTFYTGYEIMKYKTCCSQSLTSKTPFKWNFDYILDTKKYNSKLIPCLKGVGVLSDHRPIVRTVAPI